MPPPTKPFPTLTDVMSPPLSVLSSVSQSTVPSVCIARIDDPDGQLDATRCWSTLVFTPIDTFPFSPPPINPSLTVTFVIVFSAYSSVWQTTSPTGLILWIEDPEGQLDFNVCWSLSALVFNVYIGIVSHVTVPSVRIDCMASPTSHIPFTRFWT